MIVLHKKHSKEVYKEIPVKIPAGAGPQWKGISHKELYQSIVDAGHARGYEVFYRAGALTRNKFGVAMAFALSKPTLEPYLLEDWSFRLGVSGSNARTAAFKFYVGGWCRAPVSVGFVSEELVFRRRDSRHLKCLDLGKTLDRVFLEMPDCLARFPKIVQDLKDREITTREFQRIVHAAARDGKRGCISWGRIGRMTKLWQHCEILHDAQEKNTSWRLMVAAARVIQANSPFSQMRDLNYFRNLLPTAGMLHLPKQILSAE